MKSRYLQFKTRCLSHRETLGLGDWRFSFENRPLRDKDKTAETTIDLDQHLARFVWNSAWRPKRGEPWDAEDTAWHETLHVAFYEMLRAAASSHNDLGKRVSALEHSLINRVARALSRR